MQIAKKRVKSRKDFVEAAEAGQVLYFDADQDMWVTIDVVDLPVSVDGITATTVGTALKELADAIALL